MNTLPTYKIPAFWRGLAAEWRGPWTEATEKGICLQITLRVRLSVVDDAIGLLHTFEPTTSIGCFFFPLGDRTSRATLCDHIANTLEHEANQTPTAQA